jgi:hypothetical protein
MALRLVGCDQISGYRKRRRFVFQVAMDLVRNATAVAQVDDVDSELIAALNLVLKKKAHVPTPDLVLALMLGTGRSMALTPPSV